MKILRIEGYVEQRWPITRWGVQLYIRGLTDVVELYVDGSWVARPGDHLVFVDRREQTDKVVCDRL